MKIRSNDWVYYCGQFWIRATSNCGVFLIFKYSISPLSIWSIKVNLGYEKTITTHSFIGFL